MWRRSRSSRGYRRGSCRNMFRGTYSGFCCRPRYVADAAELQCLGHDGGLDGHITCAASGIVRPPVHPLNGGCPMLEQYFFKPSTIDRLRGSWIATEIEAYVAWLAEQGYGAKTVWRRVPIGFAFGEFAWERGGRTVADLSGHVEAFV